MSKKKKGKQSSSSEIKKSPEENKPLKKKGKNFFDHVYRHNYKQLLWISVILIIASLAVIGYKIATTGDFIDKGVSLKGGITLTILTEQQINTEELESFLVQELPQADFNIRTTSEFGVQKSIIIEASDTTSEELIKTLQEIIPEAKQKQNISLDTTDPILGNLSFIQTMKAVFIAFLFMAIVVFLYFGETLSIKILATVLTLVAGIMVLSSNSMVLTIIAGLIAVFLILIYIKYSIPSVAVILAAFSDIMFAVAVLNILGAKLGIAGIAAFLMLIGYSVDTDILMSVRVLKRKEGSVYSRIIGAMKTGLTMDAAALVVIIAVLVFSQSQVIIQIMTVLLIGLIGDIIFTWIQNAGILRWYLEKKGKK